jgi:hypothetical protein
MMAPSRPARRPSAAAALRAGDALAALAALVDGATLARRPDVGDRLDAQIEAAALATVPALAVAAGASSTTAALDSLAVRLDAIRSRRVAWDALAPSDRAAAACDPDRSPWLAGRSRAALVGLLAPLPADLAAVEPAIVRERRRGIGRLPRAAYREAAAVAPMLDGDERLVFADVWQAIYADKGARATLAEGWAEWREANEDTYTILLDEHVERGVRRLIRHVDAMHAAAYAEAAAVDADEHAAIRAEARGEIWNVEGCEAAGLPF